MSHAEAWARALAQAETSVGFSLSFARLGLTAECRSLSAAEISSAMALSGEAAARQLLYLACPGLQQAGEAMEAAGTIRRAADITLKLPYSDVLQAASLILRHSGGGAGMVSAAAEEMQSAESAFEEADLRDLTAVAQADTQMDGYALLRQWAAEDRAAEGAAAFEEGREPDAFFATRQPDAFFATRQLQQAWNREVSVGLPSAEAETAAITAEQVAWELYRRLRDAAGNM